MSAGHIVRITRDEKARTCKWSDHKFFVEISKRQLSALSHQISEITLRLQRLL